MLKLRLTALNRMLLVLAIVPYLLIARPAIATVIYNFTGTCTNNTPPFNCGPLGVLTTQVTTVTGSLTLAIPISPIAQQWDASDVQAYSFTLDSFQITDANSSLSNSLVGNIPFTTTTLAPFSPGDGFLLARYDPDPSVFLNISLAGVNLVQGTLTSCGVGNCQTLVNGTWSRVAVAPEPASLILFGSGLAGVGLVRMLKWKCCRKPD